ncbi:hypothetical protein AB0H83_35090 [Dactylosporangium sp. NPDC050688]|uniref:hypothetical protein n=1 Tax=Dactylosporangium sp. NPDC050688 TaxID=3157217 RepID=UPI0033FF8A9D
MNRRLWFDLPATALHAEHALSRSTDTGQPALLLRNCASPLLAGNGIPALHATPAASAVHTDPLGTGTGASTRAVRAGTYRLPLTVRSPLLGMPLRDLLRHGMHAGHVWFTVDVDPGGLRAIATRPVRDIGDPPAGAAWRDAVLTVDGLGSYPGQTCPGYRLGGDLARFRLDVLQRMLADTGCSHIRHSPVFVTTDGGRTWLVDEFGDRAPVTDDGDGWWRVAHPALHWAAAPITLITLNAAAGPEPAPVFEPCGPGGDLVRCRVCGAVEEIAYRELPWPSGTGVDTTRTCTICGSWEGSDPILGWHRNPWPPPPEHTSTVHNHTEEPRR